MDRDEILLFMCDIFLRCLNKWSKNVVQNAQLQMLQAEHYMTSQQPLSIWRIWHREKINRPSYFIRLLGVNHVCLRCSKSGLGVNGFIYSPFVHIMKTISNWSWHIFHLFYAYVWKYITTDRITAWIIYLDQMQVCISVKLLICLMYFNLIIWFWIYMSKYTNRTLWLLYLYFREWWHMIL